MKHARGDFPDQKALYIGADFLDPQLSVAVRRRTIHLQQSPREIPTPRRVAEWSPVQVQRVLER